MGRCASRPCEDNEESSSEATPRRADDKQPERKENLVSPLSMEPSNKATLNPLTHHTVPEDGTYFSFEII